MEHTALVMQRLALLSYALLAGTEGTKVLDGLGDGVAKESKDDTSSLASFDFDIEEYLVGNGLGTIFFVWRQQRTRRVRKRLKERMDRIYRENYAVGGSGSRGRGSCRQQQHQLGDIIGDAGAPIRERETFIEMTNHSHILVTQYSLGRGTANERKAYKRKESEDGFHFSYYFVRGVIRCNF